MKILMATDGSRAATAALETAARLLKAEDRNFDILCVVPPYRARNGAEADAVSREKYEAKLRGQTARTLEHARALLCPGAKTINIFAKTGSAAPLIAEETADYDLTVIGARGIGDRDEFGLGPVASRVAEYAPGPVLIGRTARSDDGPQVLVAVDGSDASLRAVETLSALFDLSTAQVCLMYVAETPWLNLEQDASEEEKDASEAGLMEREFVHEGDAVIARARAILGNPHLLVSSRMEEGNPATEILAEAERSPYDLIVLGATGNRDVKHRMLGSVSTRLALDAPCSVLIVREPGETG